MIEEITVRVLENLQTVGVGMALFVITYISNMCFSVYVNCKLLGEVFEWNRITNSLLKIFSFCFGAGLLCVAVTTIPQFSNLVGFEIPAEYSNVLENIVIVGVFIIASCKYAIEAFGKMKEILSSSESQITLEIPSEEFNNLKNSVANMRQIKAKQRVLPKTKAEKGKK